MIRLLTAVLVLLALPLSAQEREEILSYDVRVELRDGGLMEVTEAIEVRVLGEQIRRGIYRDFPTRFPREEGFGDIRAPFEVLAVIRDGNPEPYALEDVGGPGGRGGVRVRIGDANVLLSHGVHRYEIVYETSRWMRFGDERVRLDWNVTGNGWDFPILSASAAIEVPRSATGSAVALEAWTGPEGSTAQDATWSWDAAEGVARFATTGPLDPREGFTVRLDLPAGVVAPPTDELRAEWFREDWGGYLAAGIVVALVVGVYLLMWFRVGRDPRPGTLVVRYQPPRDFSPAGLGYLRRRGFHPSQLVAGLVSLAVRGAITIEQDDDEWELREAGELPDDAPAEERHLHEMVVKESGLVTLSGSPDEALRDAVSKMKKDLARQIEKIYFVNNRTWFVAGAAVSLAGLGVLALLSLGEINPVAFFLAFWLAGWTVGTGTLVYRVFGSWRAALGGDVGQLLAALAGSLFALPFVGAEILVGGMLIGMVPFYLVVAAAAVGVVNVVFYHLLERPTMKGRRVLDELEGFREFLGATEEDRFDRMQAPEKSLELFERYLPHAIALGVENEWAARFEGILAAATVGGAAGASAGGRTLAWYSGAAGSAGLGSMTSSLGGSLSSSLSSASAPPASSGGSGGGGGGSSGGGGGGGGGGGW